MNNEKKVKKKLRDSPRFSLMAEYVLGDISKTALCAKYHISPKTLDKMVRKYRWNETKEEMFAVKAKESLFEMITEKTMTRVKIWRVLKRQIDFLCRQSDLIKDSDEVPNSILSKLQSFDSIIDKDANKINDAQKQKQITTHVSMNVITNKRDVVINPWSSSKLIDKKKDIEVESEEVKETEVILNDGEKIVEKELPTPIKEEVTDIPKENPEPKPQENKKQRRIGGVIRNGNK